MRKIFLKIFLVILICTLFLTGCQKKVGEEHEEKNATPLFYKIRNNETNSTIYLLGSIHAADDSIYPLDDTIMSAYNKSDYLAVEVDIIDMDYELLLEYTGKMLCEEGVQVKDYLGDELYNKMVKVLKEKNSYNLLVDEYKPVFIYSLFQDLIMKDAGLDSRKGVDRYFLELAKESEKEILEIETAEMQYNLLLNSPDKLYQILIESCVDNYDENVLAVKILYAAWKQGNEFVIEKSTYEIDEEELAKEDIEILEEYIQQWIVDRNYGMVSRLEQYMFEGKNVFCVVGLGHVVGEEGIVELLEQKGYNIEKLD